MASRIAIFVVMAGRNAGGPETYEHSLIRNLAQLDQTTEYTVYGFTGQALESFRVEQDNFTFRKLPGSTRITAMSLGLSKALKRDRINLLHAAYIAPPHSRTDYLFTLHCSSPFVHPEMFPPAVRWRLKFLIWRGMHTARHILCVSRNTLELAAEYYGIPEERMSVSYNGVGDHFTPIATDMRRAILDRYGVSGRYFLFVGRFEPRKNVPRIIEAFHKFHQEVDQDVKLVLAGSSTWDSEEVNATLTRLALSDSIRCVGHVDNQDLPALYSGAEAFIFPSLWEGFGIPVIEAMACGAPVLTSNLSSLPEVAGDAALMVDPTSVDEITHGMERLATDRALHQDLCERGLARAAEFSWQRTAKHVLGAYQRFTK